MAWCLVCFVLMLPIPADAADAVQIALRHQVTPGSMTLYDVRVEAVHRRREPADAPARREIRTGKLTRVIFDEGQPGQASCAQMLELEPAAVSYEGGTDAKRNTDTQPASSQPSALTLPMRAARVLLNVGPIQPRRSPFILPARSAAMKNVLETVVRVTGWPEEPVSLNQTWEQPFAAGPIRGRHQFRVEALEHDGRDTHVTLKIQANIEQPGSSTADKLLSASSTLVWSVGQDELLSLDGMVAYRKPEADGGGHVSVQVRFERTARRQLPAGRLAVERRALLRLVQAVSAYQRGDLEGALRDVRRFRKRWALSFWQPVADDLAQRIEGQRRFQQPLPTEQLKETLVSLLAFWTRAEADHDAELLERCLYSLTHLTRVNRPELCRLLDDSDGRWRALACFTLAFGKAPADVALIQRHSADSDVRARRSALHALAIRASPLTDGQRLLDAARDEDAAVRCRACEALGTCLTKVSPYFSAAGAVLIERLSDDSPEVVLTAARTLMRRAAPDEITRLKQAANNTASPALRAALREIVEEEK